MPYELKISLLYLAVGVGWILTSDFVVETVLPASPGTALLQTYKGIGYVLITAGLLYVLLRRELRRRAKVELQVRDSEANFRYLFMNNPRPMWVIDLETTAFLEINDAAQEQYGYSRAEFLSMTLRDIRSPDDIQSMNETFARFQQAAPPFNQHGEWQHRCKDGRFIDVELIAHRIDYQGKTAMLAVLQDITERKRLQASLVEQEKLRLALQQEQDLRAMRNQFMRTVSHEFRTPLASIALSAEMLENYRERMGDEAIHKHFVQIHQQIKHLTEMLDDISLVLKTDTAAIQFQPMMLDLVTLCRALVDGTKLNDKDKHTVTFTHIPSTIQFHGDEKLLRYAVGNLLNNAVKYSPKGGEVLIDARVKEHAVVIMVKDQGIGIPTESIPHLFEPFYRANNTGEIFGTGLGLAIVKQAVDLHNGEIEVSSTVGEGSTFTIRLPIS